MPTFRVRFAPQQSYKFSSESQPGKNSSKPSSESEKKTSQRSRFGCRECRERRVKCDETFPWQLEVPWLSQPTINQSPCSTLAATLKEMENVDARLLQYWLEQMSPIVALDPDDNPMAFRIVNYMSFSPSLVYVIQCVSAGHEQYFQQHKMSLSLEQRSKALISFRDELQKQTTPSQYSFLTLLMLGMSSSWMAMDPTDYGKEHLLAARSIVHSVLEKKDSLNDEFTHLVMGFYVYWDMACSFCLDPEDYAPHDTTLIETYVNQVQDRFHPIAAHSIDLYYTLGHLGRYCRSVVEGRERDILLETYLENQLLVREAPHDGPHAALLSEAFRKQGLLMLYRFCGRVDLDMSTSEQSQEDFSRETETVIRGLALETLDLLFQTPLDSTYLNLHTIPLLNAGAELTADDAELRKKVKAQLEAVYSTNRILPTLWVIQLLQELWAIRDGGLVITWLELMLVKEWRLRIG
ncbi:hypothetical protein FQN53_003311 [Emmonsiellopsis sp. PD_33]|nr:hypothetical protein FQN53_003311 [Emmonsiellopsis sp. PD_33]